MILNIIQQVTSPFNNKLSVKLASFNKMAICSYSSTKQCSESECVDDDREDANSDLDCTMDV